MTILNPYREERGIGDLIRAKYRSPKNGKTLLIMLEMFVVQ